MFQNRRKKYQTLNDDELLTLYKSKAQSLILGEYYLRYSHLVFGVALKYFKNKADAEDITMIVFETLPEKLAKHNIHNFKGWLYSVTKNACLMKLRKKGELTAELKTELEDVYDISDVHSREVQLTQLEKAINDLADEQRICIQLFYIEQKSYQQITEETQLPLKKVKSALQNGKRNLKIKLEESEEFKSAI
jgi:RNA polymerase sigma-70 factor (ECF subfamily)